MPRPGVSLTLRDRIMRSSAPESPIVLLELNHPQLADTVRVVNDTEKLTHNGADYAPIRLRVVWPDDQEEQAPRATIAIDNVDKELVKWIEVSNGAVGATITMKKVLRSSPNYVEMEVKMDVIAIELKTTFVEVTLGFVNVYFKPLIRVTYRPETHPGIF